MRQKTGFPPGGPFQTVILFVLKVWAKPKIVGKTETVLYSYTIGLCLSGTDLGHIEQGALQVLCGVRTGGNSNFVNVTLRSTIDAADGIG